MNRTDEAEKLGRFNISLPFSTVKIGTMKNLLGI
jgi:hypothetical protein